MANHSSPISEMSPCQIKVCNHSAEISKAYYCQMVVVLIDFKNFSSCEKYCKNI